MWNKLLKCVYLFLSQAGIFWAPSFFQQCRALLSYRAIFMSRLEKNLLCESCHQASSSSPLFWVERQQAYIQTLDLICVFNSHQCSLPCLWLAGLLGTWFCMLQKTWASWIQGISQVEAECYSIFAQRWAKRDGIQGGLFEIHQSVPSFRYP